MPVKKRTPNKKESLDKKYNKLKVINIALILLIVTISISFTSYIFLNKPAQTSKVEKTEPKKTTQNIDKNYEKELEEYRKERIEKHIKESKKFEEYTEDLDKEYEHKPKDDIQKVEKPIIEEKEKTVINDKPKLAIVIDDVTTSHQIKVLKSLGYKVNISIMPPTSNHKNSDNIAKGLEFYMIHFPLQATNFKFEEENTLHINDSYEKIEKRVAQIRKWYPDAKYTNNHTGSMFTSNKEAMDRLYKALIKYDFIFVDSRTTSKSVVNEVASNYNMPYIARNIFLDNTQEFNYIQTQLKKAIEIAKKNGYSIAIGHPHKTTFEVLKKSHELLKDLELVYIDKIPTK